MCVSANEDFGLQMWFRNELSSLAEVTLYLISVPYISSYGSVAYVTLESLYCFQHIYTMHKGTFSQAHELFWKAQQQLYKF